MPTENLPASGGSVEIIEIGGIEYAVHTFTSGGTFTVDSEIEAEYLVVAGGAGVFNDTGYSAGDRTFSIKWRIKSRDELAQVQRLLKLHRFIRVATREGLFDALPQSVNDRGGEAS